MLSLNELKNKFQIRDNYFYLPNHFWKHKNHIVVYKAIQYLKKNKHEVYLVTTGEKSDYRNPKYIKEIENYIVDNGLENNINHLGIIEMNEVYSLIKHSKAIINPSLFEGWGTSVEHARYFRKHVIASNIKIHLEQNYYNKTQKINNEHAKYFCHYFDPKNYIELSNLILERLNENNDFKDDFLYQKNHSMIVRDFYLRYLNIIKSVINKNKY